MFAIALFVVLPVIWLLLTNWQLTLLALGILALVRLAAGQQSREAPAAGYLPRWTTKRRQDAQRELAQWQAWFDAAA
jgi:multisubunit Na+/H+ antiporter MnhE subunit